jgi:hypothetical protein
MGHPEGAESVEGDWRIMETIIPWLLASDEPWTRYRTRLNLLKEPFNSPSVCSDRLEMLAHPRIQELIAHAAGWDRVVLKRHNDAGHPLYAISTLAHFGLRAEDPGMDEVIGKILAHQSGEGAFQALVNIPRAFGGDGLDAWRWMACDAPTLLYSLLSFGLEDDPRVTKGLEYLSSLVDENGWRCVCDPELGRFHGPGRRTDPCPVANVYALKALAGNPEMQDVPAAHAGVEMLLSHWSDDNHPKPYLFGAGTDYRKLKYPYVWYDILHVADTLSHFAFAREDPRFIRLVNTITAQAGPQGFFTASSMYQAWKGWSFADKKKPSPWLTYAVYAILERSN